jgi:AhpD family alkylhydroperoxidase
MARGPVNRFRHAKGRDLVWTKVGLRDFLLNNARVRPRITARKDLWVVARIPYADIDRDEPRTLATEIAAQRGSVLHLYRMLLHSPPVAAGWLRYLTAVRQESSLPGTLRELVIIRVALLNGAPYEVDQHAPIARAEGLSEAQLDALPTWRDSDVFDSQQRAVLALTDAMTCEIRVPDGVFAVIRAEFNERSIVELTATVAAYNMVSRFLEALQIRSHDTAKPAAPPVHDEPRERGRRWHGGRCSRPCSPGRA